MAKDTGTVNIHGKEYKTVAARVQEFREKHGVQYSIVTEIIESGDPVVMKASITEQLVGNEAPVVIATGHAEESRTSSQINRTSALENAETSAIGRALAAFGLAGTEFASADEVAQAIHQQRTPAKPTAKQVEAQARKVFPEAEAEFAQRTVGKISPKQLSFMQANFTDLGIDDRDDKLNYVIDIIGRKVESSTDLTLAEAKKVIDRQLADKEGR